MLRLGRPRSNEQIDTSQRRGTCAADHQLDFVDALAHDLESVEHGGGDDDRGAMLVVVEDRDLHALAQFALDIETFGRLDVFQVDATEGRLQRRDHFDQLVRIALVDLDVEHVDAGELLEQYRLAFHHRLGRQGADRAQAQHRGAIGDNRDKIATCGVAESVYRVGDDFLGGGGDAGRIRQR
jgi:hypothetical protein